MEKYLIYCFLLIEVSVVGHMVTDIACVRVFIFRNTGEAGA